MASNAAYLAVLTLSNLVAGLLIFPFLSRVLSVEAFGVFGFSMAFVIAFQVIVEFGFMISATESIARNRDLPGRVARILASTMLAKALLAVCAFALFFVSAALIPIVRENLLVAFLFLVSGVLTAMLPDFYFRGIEKMRAIALRALTARLLALGLVLLLVRGDQDLPLVPASLAAGNLLALLLSFASISRDGVKIPVPRFHDAFDAIRAGLGYFASRAASAINQSSGAFVLGLQYTPASVSMGQFAAASRIASAGELAVVPVSDAIYPHMVRTRDYRLFARVYLFGLAGWFAGCLFVFVFAREICTFVLGDQFTEAGDLLRILVVGTFFAYSSNLFGYPALTPLGLAHHANIALVISVLLNTFIYLVLWVTGSITPESVCVVVALTNLAVFVYRFSLFWFHWHRFSQAQG